MHKDDPGLDALVQVALELPVDGRASLAFHINQWLRAHRGIATDAEREQALRWIDEKTFASLRDHHGVSCRAEAAELLVSLGYPYAMMVSPEALALARSAPDPRGRFEPVANVMLAACYLPLLALAVLHPPETGCIHTGTPTLLLVAALSGVSAWVLRFGRERLGAQRVVSNLANCFAVGATVLAAASTRGFEQFFCCGALITFAVLGGRAIVRTVRSVVHA